MNEFVTDGYTVFATQFVAVDLKTISPEEAYHFVFDDVWSREIFVMWVAAQKDVEAEAPVEPRVEGRFNFGETIEVKDHPNEEWLQRTFVGYNDDNGEFMCQGHSATDTLFSWKLARHIPT